MKKIIKFESCDGEIFDTEEECREHEKEFYPDFSGFTCLDKDMQLLMLDPENRNDLEWMYNNADYICIHDFEEAEPGLTKLFNCGPFTLKEADLICEGFYMWDKDSEAWIDIDDQILKYRMLRKEFVDKLKELGRL